MTEVKDWNRVAIALVITQSKREEISQQSSTETEKRLALGKYWVITDRDASWKKLAGVFYQKEEERALAFMKQYLQQGMCSS